MKNSSWSNLWSTVEGQLRSGNGFLSEVEGANCEGIVISRQRGKNIQRPWVMTGNNFTLFLGKREEGRRRHGRRQMPNMSGL